MLTWNTEPNDGLHTGKERLLLVETDDKGWPRIRVETADNCEDHDGRWLPEDAVIKYRVLDNPFGVFTVRRFKDITPTGVVVGYRWDYRAYSGYELPNRPRTARGVCDSFEHGMELGVQYYKLLVRAIFEGGV